MKDDKVLLSVNLNLTNKLQKIPVSLNKNDVISLYTDKLPIIVLPKDPLCVIKREIFES